MVRLEHCAGMGDWFALDNNGTSVEGTHDEWVAVLAAIEKGGSAAFKRVAVAHSTGGFLFTSPRNSTQAFDASIDDREIPGFLAQARGVLQVWWESQYPLEAEAARRREGAGRSTATAPVVLSDPAVLSRREISARWDPAEHLIATTQLFVEEMGHHSHLTRAIDLLKRAQSAVADYVDRRPTASEMGFTEGEPIDLRTLQRMSEARVPAFKKALADWVPMEWGCELGEELGEFMAEVLRLGGTLSKVLGAAKKRAREPHPTLPGKDITGKDIPSLDAIGSELADVVIVASLLFSRLGLDLNNAVRTKWNATSEKVGWKERL